MDRKKVMVHFLFLTVLQLAYSSSRIPKKCLTLRKSANRPYNGEVQLHII